MFKADKILLGAAGTVGAGIASWRLFFPYIVDDIRCIQSLRRTAEATKQAILEDKRIIDMFEDSAAKHPKKPFIILEDKKYTYEYVDAMANRVANSVAKWDVTSRDTVAMMIYNEPAFVWTFLGINNYSMVFFPGHSRQNINVNKTEFMIILICSMVGYYRYVNVTRSNSYGNFNYRLMHALFHIRTVIIPRDRYRWRDDNSPDIEKGMH